MRRTRPNPFMSAAVAPFVPWILGAAVLYLFGDKILAALGARVAGVNVEEFKKDASTVREAIVSPISTLKDLVDTVKVASGGYISQADQAAAIESIKGQLSTGASIPVPYPNPQSQAEFRANIDAINVVLAAQAPKGAGISAMKNVV